MSEQDDLVIRPRKVRVVALPVAVVLLVAFVVPAALLRNSSTGVRFGLSDQWALALIGACLAAGVLLFTRPMVRADGDGVDVRGILFSRRLSWTIVRAVSFPDGAPWARLELGSDEYVPVLAIQAVDGERAVSAIRSLRAAHRAGRAILEEKARS